MKQCSLAITEVVREILHRFGRSMRNAPVSYCSVSHTACAVSRSSASQDKLPVFKTVDCILSSKMIKHLALVIWGSDHELKPKPISLYYFLILFFLCYLFFAWLHIRKWSMYTCDEKYLIKHYREITLRTNWLSLYDLVLVWPTSI